MKQKLTIDQAIDHGFSMYLNGDEVAFIDDIIEQKDVFPEGAQLLDPKENQTVVVTNESIRDLIGEFISNSAGDLCGETCSAKVYNHACEVDWTPVTEFINEQFKKFTYHKISNAVLTL